MNQIETPAERKAREKRLADSTRRYRLSVGEHPERDLVDYGRESDPDQSDKSAESAE